MTEETEAAAPPPAPARRVDRLGLIAIIAAGLALVLAALPYLSPAVTGSQARAYLVSHPEVLDQMLEARQANAARDQTQGINAAVAANASLLKPDPRDPGFGPADAKVTVVEFFDFRCPGCKAVAPDYRRLVAAHPEVRFVFKDWPILDRGQDAVSHYAARAALAAHQQGKYLEVWQALLAAPALTEASVDRILGEQGVDVARAKAYMASAEPARHLADIQTTAQAFRLVGTPTFLINGKTTTTIEPREVAQAIEAAKRS